MDRRRRRTTRPAADNSPSASSRPDETTYEPTAWNTWNQTTLDCVIVAQACLDGVSQYVLRRPHERERPIVIASGSVLCYPTKASGILRWTDGREWSPSRIHPGSELVYRCLVAGHGKVSGGKKLAIDKSRETNKPLVFGEVGYPEFCDEDAREWGFDNLMAMQKNLVGSLVNCQWFTNPALVKKTLSYQYDGGSYHIVSYYDPAHILERRLVRPWDSERFRNVFPSRELIEGLGWNVGIQENHLAGDIHRRLGVAVAFNSMPLSTQGMFFGDARRWSELALPEDQRVDFGTWLGPTRLAFFRGLTFEKPNAGLDPNGKEGDGRYSPFSRDVPLPEAGLVPSGRLPPVLRPGVPLVLPAAPYAPPAMPAPVPAPPRSHSSPAVRQQSPPAPAEDDMLYVAGVPVFLSTEFDDVLDGEDSWLAALDKELDSLPPARLGALLSGQSAASPDPVPDSQRDEPFSVPSLYSSAAGVNWADMLGDDAEWLTKALGGIEDGVEAEPDS